MSSARGRRPPATSAHAGLPVHANSPARQQAVVLVSTQGQRALLSPFPMKKGSVREGGRFGCFVRVRVTPVSSRMRVKAPAGIEPAVG